LVASEIELAFSNDIYVTIGLFVPKNDEGTKWIGTDFGRKVMG